MPNENIWKYATTSLAGVILGMIMSFIVGMGPQRQLDVQSTEIANLQVEVIKLQVEVARISEHLGVNK